jgi:hypothetical protein
MGFGVEKLNMVCHVRRRTGCLVDLFVYSLIIPGLFQRICSVNRVDLTGNFQWYRFGFKM